MAIRMVIMAVVAVGILTVGVKAFRVRAEVAGARLTEKIDHFLGELDVKQKEVQLDMTKFRTGLTHLHKAQVKLQVQCAQMENRTAPVTDRIQAIDQALKIVREKLSSNQPTSIAGTEYQPHQLQEFARKMLQDRDRDAAVLDGYRKSLENLRQVSGTLKTKQTEYQNRLTGIENQFALMDSRQTALLAMREAASSIGGNDQTLVENAAELERKVSDLYAGVEAELAAETARWDHSSLSRVDVLDAIIASAQGSDDLIAKIDQTLGRSGGASDLE
jgi:chromosome segregation ATPase